MIFRFSNSRVFDGSGSDFDLLSFPNNNQFKETLSKQDDINPNNFKELINRIKTEHDISGNIWKPIRIALTGSEHGPDISNYATILGPKTCVERIKLFLDLNVD